MTAYLINAQELQGGPSFAHAILALEILGREHICQIHCTDEDGVGWRTIRVSR